MRCPVHVWSAALPALDRVSTTNIPFAMRRSDAPPQRAEPSRAPPRTIRYDESFPPSQDQPWHRPFLRSACLGQRDAGSKIDRLHAEPLQTGVATRLHVLGLAA